MPTPLDWYLQVNLKARQLRLLVALDGFGNLKNVADATNVTVPAVSKALAELEKGLGLELFTRTAQGLRPTVYGECLIRHARSMLADLEQARDELKSLSSGAGGKVNVGVYPGSTTVLMPRALVLLKQRSPSANVLVTEGTNLTLLPQLWEGKLDLIVGRLPVLPPSSGLETKALLAEQLRVVAGPKHPLARRKRLRWSDLKNYPWVLPPVPSLMREPLEQALVQNGVEFEKNYIETGSIQLTRAYLYLTDAIAVMANASAHDKSQPLAVLPLTVSPLTRLVGVLWSRNRPLSPIAQMMMECLEKAAATMSGATGG